MNTTLRQPPTINFLSPFGFKFVINKIPNVDFLVQATEIPQVAMNAAKMPTPFVEIPFAGDHIQYSPLNIIFKVDEDLINYIELYSWFKGLGFPFNFQEAQEVYKEGAYSDGTLTILNSAMNPCAVVTYYDMFPTGISQLSFDSRNTDVKYVDCTATFLYRSFDIKSVTNHIAWA